MNKILITGGSSDIALSLLEKINKKENTIYLSAFNEIEGMNNENIQYIKADLSTKEGIEKFLEQIKDLDISHYIQLQGNSTLDDMLINQNFEDLEYNLNINLNSTIMILSHIVKQMKKNHFGRIVLMSTASANSGGGEESFGYGLSKHSIQYVTKHLAKYYSKYNIITNSVSPGFIKTKFHTKRLNRNEEFLKNREASVRLGYAGVPKDVSSLIYYLAFENKFVCGETIKIDGADFV